MLSFPRQGRPDRDVSLALLAGMSIGVGPAGKPIVAFGAAERGFEAADFVEITGQAGVARRTVPGSKTARGCPAITAMAGAG